MKTVNLKIIRGTLRVTCRHMVAMILAAALLTGIAAAENSRKMVRITWGGEQEVIEEQVQEEKDKALRKQDYFEPLASGQVMVVRTAEGERVSGETMSDNITGLKTLRAILAASGYPEPGTLFDEWNADNICVFYDCVPTGEYHLDSSENENGYITEKYSIDPADRIVSNYWIEMKKAGQRIEFRSWLSGNSSYSTSYEQSRFLRAEDVSIPGMEKAIYICEAGGKSKLVMCRPLESEIEIRKSPIESDQASDIQTYGYEFLEFSDMSPEEVAEFFAE